MMTNIKIKNLSIEYNIPENIIENIIKELEDTIRKEKNLDKNVDKWSMLNKMLVEVRLPDLLIKHNIKTPPVEKIKVYKKW